MAVLTQAARDRMVQELMTYSRKSSWYEATGKMSPKYNWLMPRDEQREELRRKEKILMETMRRHRERQEEQDAIASILETARRRG